jgi:hypothetical protein
MRAEVLSTALQVLLPISPDVEVSEELFQRTSADIKQEHLRAKQRREQMDVLMTRAMREKLKKKNMKQHSFARLCIRFPEGVILQGAQYFTLRCLSIAEHEPGRQIFFYTII